MATITVNAQPVEVEPGSATILLDFLRCSLGLIGPRFGCGEGLCGACMVLVDGRPRPSCDVPLWSVEGTSITTVEGLGTEAAPHAVQTAFIKEQAMQCGFCMSGILISAAALLRSNPAPTDDEIRHALQRNL